MSSITVSRGGANDLLIPFLLSSFDPIDATTYFFGATLAATVAGVNKVWLPRSGTITKIYVNTVVAGTQATAETAALNFRLNGTIDTVISSVVTFDALVNTFHNTGLNIPVAADDYFELKIVMPTWVTNPTTVYISGTVYIE